MIREEQYKCLEPESAALKHLDFLPWAPDYGNNYDFFHKNVMIQCLQFKSSQLWTLNVNISFFCSLLLLHNLYY